MLELYSTKKRSMILLIYSHSAFVDYCRCQLVFNINFTGFSPSAVAVSVTLPAVPVERNMAVAVPLYSLLVLPTVSSSLVMSPLITHAISAGPSTVNITLLEAPFTRRPFLSTASMRMCWRSIPSAFHSGLSDTAFSVTASAVVSIL